MVLVAVALFFCHGAFGYAHQSSPPGANAVHTAHSSMPNPGDGGVDDAHPGDAYFATLIALLFGTFLLLDGRVSAVTRLAVPSWERGDRGQWALPPPRGPALPSLQVFRL